MISAALGSCSAHCAAYLLGLSQVRKEGDEISEDALYLARLGVWASSPLGLTSAEIARTCPSFRMRSGLQEARRHFAVLPRYFRVRHWW